jgi:fucose 4-O-acetylase-like acetyltransferase
MTVSPSTASAAPAGGPAAAHSPERSRWIDAARGVGIVLIVAGHNPGLEPTEPVVTQVLFAFHTPLFFTIAGATFSRHCSWRAAGLRAAGLWLPYLVLCVLSLPLAMRRGGYESLPHTLLGILYGTGHTIAIPPLWFLPCLALTLLVVHAMDAARGHRQGEARALWGDALAALTCGALGVELLHALGTPTPLWRLAWGTLATSGAPLSLDLIPIAAAFVIFGRLVRELADRCAAQRALPWAGATVCTLAATVLYVREDPHLNLNDRVVVPGVTTLVVAALACTALMLLAYALQHTRAAVLAAALGTKTLVILWLHAGVEKRAWDALAGVMPPVPALAASTAVAVLLPYAIDSWLTRLPRVRGLIYPQAWLRGNRAASR